MKLETGKPQFEGRYVVYVEGVLGWLQPQIVAWSHGHWHYYHSTQKYDGEVFGWIGPLPVMKFNPKGDGVFEDETQKSLQNFEKALKSFGEPKEPPEYDL